MSKSVEVRIEGLSALLMHAFPMVPVEGIEKMTAADQAKVSEYRTPGGELHIPAVAVQRALVDAATYSKGKGRGSLQKVAAAVMMVTPEYLVLDQQSYTIDSRPVVIAATKGRIIRHRPRFDKWSVAFTLEYDERLMSAEQVRQIVDNCGSRVGLLDFRPARKGPFGRFVVTSWEAN